MPFFSVKNQPCRRILKTGLVYGKLCVGESNRQQWHEMVDHKEVKFCLLYTLVNLNGVHTSTDWLPYRRKVDFVQKMGFIFSEIHHIENLGVLDGHLL